MPLALDRTSSQPLYRQLERQVRAAIDDGRLQPGDRVPSVREVAAELGIGRLTVASAYEQLAAEGYLVGRVGFGTVVAADPPGRELDPATAVPAGDRAHADAAHAHHQRMPSRRASGPATTPTYDLRPGPSGLAGVGVGPALERLLREAWRDLTGTTDTSDPAGDPLLRATIADHVRTAHGGRCEPDQVVVLSGAQIGIAAATSLWAREGGTIVIEDPADPAVRRALEQTPAKRILVPIDRNGLRVDALPAAASLAVVSPRVQSVTGARLPLARRLRLLAWAAEAGAVVLEDSRADELALGEPPGQALQGLDQAGRVVHLGGFAALLHPGLHLGYAVVPAPLVDAFAEAVAAIDPGATPVQQRAFGRFLADGHLDRHLARVRRALAQRHEAALTAVRRDLGWLVSAETPSGGTRLVLTIEDARLSATEAAAAATAAGVAIEPLVRMAGGNGAGHHADAASTEPDRELLFDVGRHEPAELVRAVRIMAGAIAGALDELGREPRGVRTSPSAPPQPSAPAAPRAPAAQPPIARRWPASRRPDSWLRPMAAQASRGIRAT